MGVDSNGRNAESLKANPPAHSMSGYGWPPRTAKARAATSPRLLLAMLFNPEQVHAGRRHRAARIPRSPTRA